MKYRFNRTAISVLGLTALLAGCTPSGNPAGTPTPAVASTATAAGTEAPSTPATLVTASPTADATGTATPEAGQTSATASGNVPVVEGVSITVVKAGSGDPLAKGQTASFHYTGWLEGFESTKQFDSSRDRQPITLPIGAGQVIPGWDQGLVGMLPGEIRRLEISSEMAYGAAGRPPAIPPNSTLYFEVEYVPASASAPTPAP